MINKKIAVLFDIASLIFYIVAIIRFFDSGFSSGVVWLCLGSAFLCLGATHQSKKKKPQDEE